MSGAEGTADLVRLDALALRGMLLRGDVTAAEIARAHLERAAAVEPRLGAFLMVMSEALLRDARDLDERRRRGESLGPLAGVPVAVKDVLCVKGTPTTCGSRILERFVPPYDATCVARLRQAGALIMGKTNCDEFAMGSSTEHSAFKPTRNPWDLERVPGGSSGGSAAAVAACEAPMALGTDTGGSIRQPASFTGTVGLKPTYGRVSRFGLVAFASSLDQAGPITRTVQDAALALSAVAGADPRDMTCARAAVPDYAAAAAEGSRGERGAEGVRVGVPAEYFGAGADPEVETAVRAAVRALEDRGARAVEVSLPTSSYAIATYYVVATAEASSNLARYDGVRYGLRAEAPEGLRDMYHRTRGAGFGPEVKRRIMLGTYALSAGYYDAYYLKAMKVRTLIRRDFERAFERADVLIGPTTPTAAFRFGEKLDDPLAMYLSDVYTVTANLTGLPGISVPCGFTGARLPIGCQLLARHFDETTLLRAAAALEAALGLAAAPPTAVDR